MEIGPLYHWSPRARRKSILRHGLLPRQRKTCTSTDEDEPEWRQPAVCLSSAPSTAWGLSAGIFGEPGQTWDLWQIRLDQTDAVHTVPCWGFLISEFRVANRIPKSRCWWVAERTI